MADGHELVESDSGENQEHYDGDDRKEFSGHDRPYLADSAWEDGVVDALWVAAEGKQRMPGGGISGSSGSVSPAGMLHAVDPESEKVLCGHPLRPLVPFKNLQWAGLRAGIRCPECVRAAAAQ